MGQNFFRGVITFFGMLLFVALVLMLYDWRLFSRYFSVPSSHFVSRVGWYQPQETVPGGADPAIPAVTPGQGTIAAADVQAAMDYAGHRHSIALLVYRNGKMEAEKYWPPYTAETLTDSAAMHKSVVALLVGAAIRDGLIESLDDSAANYIPEWAHDGRRDITIRDLLQMTSGLAPVSKTTSPFSVGSRLLFSSHIEDVALTQKAMKPPGEEFDYNNANSQILLTILERRSGQRYAQYLSDELWHKLDGGAAKVWLDRDGGAAHGFCCIQATARDWLRVGMLILNQGQVDGRQVIPAAWIRDMVTPSAKNPDYGLHVWLGTQYQAKRSYGPHGTFEGTASAPYLAGDVVFFDGGAGQRVYIIPSANMVIVRTGDPAADWDDAYIPNTLVRGILRKAENP